MFLAQGSTGEGLSLAVSRAIVFEDLPRAGGSASKFVHMAAGKWPQSFITQTSTEGCSDKGSPSEAQEEGIGFVFFLSVPAWLPSVGFFVCVCLLFYFVFLRQPCCGAQAGLEPPDLASAS